MLLGISSLMIGLCLHHLTDVEMAEGNQGVGS